MPDLTERLKGDLWDLLEPEDREELRVSLAKMAQKRREAAARATRIYLD